MREREKKKLKNIGRTAVRKLELVGTVAFMAGLIYIAALKRSFRNEKKSRTKNSVSSQ